MPREKSPLENIIKAANSFRLKPSAPHIAKSGYRGPRISTFLNHHHDVDYGLGITHFLQPSGQYRPHTRRHYVRR